MGYAIPAATGDSSMTVILIAGLLLGAAVLCAFFLLKKRGDEE